MLDTMDTILEQPHLYYKILDYCEEVTFSAKDMLKKDSTFLASVNKIIDMSNKMYGDKIKISLNEYDGKLFVGILNENIFSKEEFNSNHEKVLEEWYNISTEDEQDSITIRLGIPGSRPLR